MLYWTEYVFFVQYSHYTGRNVKKQANLAIPVFCDWEGYLTPFSVHFYLLRPCPLFFTFWTVCVASMFKSISEFIWLIHLFFLIPEKLIVNKCLCKLTFTTTKLAGVLGKSFYLVIQSQIIGRRLF
jgi:hypothetical protein